MERNRYREMICEGAAMLKGYQERKGENLENVN